ncbi:hypothetical protein H0H93_002036 [Arthromyces matolae]|nr:hypothetical protein H0H93_002036 [Arthromyces matolae]
MPSLHNTSTISANKPDSAWCSTSALDVDYTSAPPDISAKINNQSNTNSAYGPAQPFPNPTEDGDMRYIVSNIPFDDFESVIMVAEDLERTLLRPRQPPCDTPPYTFEIGDAGKKGRGIFSGSIPHGQGSITH